MSFQSDFDWQMQFVPVIRSIIGPLLLEPAPLELDMHEATDMIVLRARDMRIACRVRRPGYAEPYPWDFTIRSRRDSGAETELSKILMRGWGDAMFYGHAAQLEAGPIARWHFIDLHSFRGHHTHRDTRRAIKCGERSNGDGTYFCWYDVRSFLPDPPILIAQSHQWHEPPQRFVPPQPQYTRAAAKPNGQDHIGPLFDRR
jgi:hypothetical protein